MDDQTKTPNQDDTPEVVDAEIVEDVDVKEDQSEDGMVVSDSTQTESQQQFDYLQNLQTQINIYISKIENLKQEIQPIKEMIDSYLSNDPMYMELSEKAKEAAKEKGKRKKELMSAPNGRNLNEKIEKIKEDQNESNKMISQLLSEYQKATGATVFEGSDGEIRQIVMVAKLVRKTDLNRD